MIKITLDQKSTNKTAFIGLNKNITYALVNTYLKHYPFHSDRIGFSKPYSHFLFLFDPINQSDGLPKDKDKFKQYLHENNFITGLFSIYDEKTWCLVDGCDNIVVGTLINPLSEQNRFIFFDQLKRFCKYAHKKGIDLLFLVPDYTIGSINFYDDIIVHYTNLAQNQNSNKRYDIEKILHNFVLGELVKYDKFISSLDNLSSNSEADYYSATLFAHHYYSYISALSYMMKGALKIRSARIFVPMLIQDYDNEALDNLPIDATIMKYNIYNDVPARAYYYHSVKRSTMTFDKFSEILYSTVMQKRDMNVLNDVLYCDYNTLLSPYTTYKLKLNTDADSPITKKRFSYIAYKSNVEQLSNYNRNYYQAFFESITTHVRNERSLLMKRRVINSKLDNDELRARSTDYGKLKFNNLVNFNKYLFEYYTSCRYHPLADKYFN